MDTAEKLALIKAPPVEEILTEADLNSALEQGLALKHYIGFEVSGFLHLGTGLITASKIADLQKAGVDCSIFLADLHAWINDKLGGNLETIQRVAGGYYKEGFRKCLEIAGADPDSVKFVLGSELYEEHSSEYLKVMIDVSKNVSLARIRRSITIMGRKLGEEINFAQLLYPPMQVADIFIQGINLCHAGTDQRKAHVIAREVAPKLTIHPLVLKKKLKGKVFEEKYKPIALHTHLILGLKTPPVWPIPKAKMQELWSEMKMSKSVPSSCVFIHDSPEEISGKMINAFCPPKETEFNPVLDWAKHIIFKFGDELEVERQKKYGGPVHFSTYEDLAKVYLEGGLHPMDLKNAVANELIKILEPARKHFSKGEPKKMLEELKELKVTR